MAQRRQGSFVRRTRSSPRGGSRRTGSLVWRGVASTSRSILAPNSQVAIEILDQVIDDIAGATIMRTIGRVSLQIETLGSRASVYMGIIVVDAEAVAAGGIPDPWADPAAWMWEDAYELISSASAEPANIIHIPLDIRVRRRMPQERNSLLFVFDNLVGSSGSVSAFISVKCLLRIP